MAAHQIMQRAQDSSPFRTGGFTFRRSTGPLLYLDEASPGEYWAGLGYAIDRGWLESHETGTYVKILQAGKDLLA
ncbi:hypothetical protein XH92_14870 [Bradyrhizobium sp. CCBAU 53421]|nr:hypothetical protein XH92_14870 [Bradyrhizobium sp. CCBAU 53421]